MKPRLLWLVLALLLCAGCGGAGDRPAPPAPTCPPCPTQPPDPTYTPYPTLAPLATYTPYPTFTPIPKPTEPPTATPAPTSSAGTRAKPLAVGESATIKRTADQLDVTILETISGKPAAEMVAKANMFNSVPAEGHEFVLARVSAKIVEGPSDKAVGLGDSDWKMVQSSGEIVQLAFGVVPPKPDFGGQGYAGSAIEGWIVAVRPTNEAISLVFDMGYDGSGGVWWAVPGN